MNKEETLKQIGLSDGEIKVYLALLKLGVSPVSNIKEETNLHRTTIYDFVEKLLNKGLASYVIKNKVKYFKAAHPDKLLSFVKEKEDNIKEALPELIKLTEFEREEIKVEVYKGKEGFKTLLNDYLRVGVDMVGFGVDETKFKERFPILMEQFFKKEKKAGMNERLLTSEKAKFTYNKKTTNYRYIPEEYFNPTPTIVYGNRVATVIWEP
ncbi:MAG: helix-turn-helix domain-containing protein, partial [Nanoarchaeota archaeon]|nr:helix-turn-helix domain-containing protein [Nanoarchaeota archaeon]